MTSDKTTIWITKSTRDKLKELGKKGETYDEIISGLMERERTEHIKKHASRDGSHE